jgi:hypothetical protein
MRHFAISILLLGSILSMSFAEQPPANTTTASCTFQDGKQISVRYESEATGEKKTLPIGKLWMPGGQPMWLFTQAELSVANSEVPIGAYSMYMIAEKDNWILILNKNVKDGSAYDEHDDLVRIAMQLGHVSESYKTLRLVFGHVAPKQCNLRIYYGETGTWAEFRER